jgi:acetyl esterase
MPLDPQVQGLLDQMAASGAPPLEEQTVAEARAGMAGMVALAQSADVGAVEDLEVPLAGGPVPVRVYRPPGPAGPPHPLLVWFHGGGWVLGDLAFADPTARDLCARSAAVVASVDYPLAPEHPFPAAPEACLGVTRWLADHAADIGADATRLAVGGDSAGGNLAAVCALLARNRGGPALSFQLLVYPVTDCLGTFPSVRHNAERYLLTADAMLWFRDQYLPPGCDQEDPAASPIYATDLSGLPPALVVTAEFDPLRDEGEAYGKRMELAGVPVTVSRYDGMVHGFFSMTAVLDAARQAMAEAATALRAALGPDA